MAANSTNQEEGYFRVLMSNGQNVNILTQSGADTFLTAQESASQFIRVNLTGAVQMRETLKGRCSAAVRRQVQERLLQIYVLFSCVADNVSRDVFEAKVTNEDLEALVDHANSIFTELTGKDIWKRTGVLTKYDQELLECFIPFNKFERVSKLMLSRDGSGSNSKPLLEVIAKLCAARSKPDMFGAPVAETLCSIVNNMQINLREDTGWESNKTFKKLEASGILAQVFRAITVPLVHPEELPRIMRILEFLHKSERVVRKKLQSGTPTGDVLDDVLAGRDGYVPVSRRNQDVMTSLKDLRASSEMFNTNLGHGGGSSDAHFCRQCSKRPMDLGHKLLCCSRCKNTWYCSRECQRADWKSHKNTCHLGIGPSKGHQSMVVTFVHANYYDIMKQLTRQMQQRGLSKADMCVEIDFYKGDGQISSPAHQKQFKVIRTKDILEGSRPAEPDWFWRGSDVYKKNVRGFLEALRDHCTRDSSNHLLCIVRFTDATPGVYRVQLASQSTSKSLVSDEACDAFLRNDFEAMERIYGGDSSEWNYIRYRRGQDMLEQFEGTDPGTNLEGLRSFGRSLVEQVQEAMQSDEYRRMREEVGTDDDEDDDDGSE